MNDHIVYVKQVGAKENNSYAVLLAPFFDEVASVGHSNE